MHGATIDEGSDLSMMMEVRTDGIQRKFHVVVTNQSSATILGDSIERYSNLPWNDQPTAIIFQTINPISWQTHTSILTALQGPYQCDFICCLQEDKPTGGSRLGILKVKWR